MSHLTTYIYNKRAATHMQNGMLARCIASLGTPEAPPDRSLRPGMLEVLWQTLFSLHDTALRLREPHLSLEVALMLRQSLRLSARQVEGTAHRLRAYGWLSPSIAAELAQGVTVLVLVADILANNQLTERETTDSYALLKRNVQRTLDSVELMRAA